MSTATELRDRENTSTGWTPVDVELLSAMIGLFPTDRPRRANRHIVIVSPSLSEGLEVDFEPVKPTSGAAVHIHPDQVLRFDPSVDVQGIAVTVDRDACPSGLFRPGVYHPEVALGSAESVVVALTEDLLRLKRKGGDAAALLPATAALLLLHIAAVTHAASSGDRGGDHQAATELLGRFRSEVERSFRSIRLVSWYAGELGTSAKTISRAAAGLGYPSPKEFIDERVTLEAKRLLVDTDESIAGVGRRLGFSEATNFTKYFIRTTGRLPHDFRTGF